VVSHSTTATILLSSPGDLLTILGVEESMILWKRAALLGFLSWLIPFAISFFVFPLKKSNAPLFATFMYMVVY
jgi:hypothetical protein